jgi:HemY protein
MRGIVWLVLLFTMAVVAATWLGSNDGLVSVYWGGWRADVSLNLALLLLLGFCAVVTLAWQAASSLLTLPQRAGRWRAERKERLAQQALREALAELWGGRWGRAHKAALRALHIQQDTPEMARDAEFQALALLLGAASLHRLQDRTGRDALLARVLAAPTGALAGAPAAPARAEDGARLLALEWALDDRDASRAADLAEALPMGLARRTQALRLKLQANRLVGQPLAALQTAHLLAHHGAFTPAAAQGLLRALAGEAFEQAHDASQLRRLWDSLDASDRQDALVQARAAQRAAQLGAHELGRGWLRPGWTRLSEVSPEARQALALALIPNLEGLPPDWLPVLDAAQARCGHDNAVLAAVGSAYAERQLWGKARQALAPAAAAPELPSAVRRRLWLRLADLARQDSDEGAQHRFERQAAALE